MFPTPLLSPLLSLLSFLIPLPFCLPSSRLLQSNSYSISHCWGCGWRQVRSCLEGGVGERQIQEPELKSQLRVPGILMGTGIPTWSLQPARWHSCPPQLTFRAPGTWKINWSSFDRNHTGNRRWEDLGESHPMNYQRPRHQMTTLAICVNRLEKSSPTHL